MDGNKEGTCIKCNEFRVIKGHSWCTKCYNNWYYHNKADKGKILKTQKEYRDRTRDKANAYSQKYYREHPEKSRLWSRSCTVKRRKANIEYLKTQIELQCSVCGYDKCFAALDFHHKDQAIKENRLDVFSYWSCLSLKKFIEKWEQVRDSIQILCANCHREIHNGGIDDANL